MEHPENTTHAARKVVYGDEIDLRELFLVIWDGKWIIIGITLLAAIFSVIYSLSLPNIYRSTALLAPASSEESRGLSGLASQYGGLASLAGINLGGLGGGVDQTVIGLEILKSRKFLGGFAARRAILPELMAAKSWDGSVDQIIYDEDLYDARNGIWVRDPEPPKSPEPSLQEAHIALSENMSVQQDADTGLVRISIETVSPSLSKQWVDWLIQDINTEVKRQDVTEAEKSIAYLQEQLQATSLSELQNVFYQLIEQQTKTIMLANARPEYLFRTIDPAVIAEEPSSPNRALICLIGTVLGGFLSLLFVLIWHFVNSSRSE